METNSYISNKFKTSKGSVIRDYKTMEQTNRASRKGKEKYYKEENHNKNTNKISTI